MDPTRLSGDAVVLARGVTVRNIEIAGAHRGGIYGLNAHRVTISGNNVHGQNASCTEGYHIPSFNLPTTVPGVGIPISDGLINGWAGIMVDESRGRGRIVIRRNVVHNAFCGDGIDVRASGSARVRTLIRRNVVRDLREGPDFQSVLAIGVQTVDHSRMVAKVTRNRQRDLGNEGDPGVLILGADSEGVFASLDGPSRLDLKIRRNSYRNSLGGFSANGMELANMGDGARANVTITDSSFSGPPGDIIQVINTGSDASIGVKLKRVIARRSTGFGNTIVIPGNNGDCLTIGNAGARSDIKVAIKDTRLTNCVNNGVLFGSNVVNGSGSAKLLKLVVDRSVIGGNRGSNLLLVNASALESFAVKVERTVLRDANGVGIGLANLAFLNLGTTDRGRFDFGGGSLGSRGGNCVTGGLLDANVLGYDISAERNWWGAASGPGLGRAVVVGGSLDASPFLGSAPARC